MTFFIVTESLTNPDDCSPLIESLSSPLSLGEFSTFENLGFILNNKLPILCVLIYRPPKFIFGFIQEFSDFLSDIILKHDRVLILGDFNIDMCCPASSLASEFINLLQSCNLTQSVKQPSHVKGHTLDLVLSCGFSVDNVNIVDFAVSDHNAGLFTVPFLCPDLKPTTLIHSRPLNSSCTLRFSQIFTASSLSSNPDAQNYTVEEHLSAFNNSCLNILDSIAPFRLRRPKPSFIPWMSEDLRNLKRQCRKAERRWKKDKLHASLISLKFLMARYQHAVKVARNNYFSNLIAEQKGNPKILFKTINSVIAIVILDNIYFEHVKKNRKEQL